MKLARWPTYCVGISRVFAVVLAFGLTAANAAEVGDDWFEIDDRTGWFVRAGARALFNVKASVSKTPVTITDGVYDDGFSWIRAG